MGEFDTMGGVMGEYLKTLDEAIDAVAGILELPEQRDRIIQCTIRIMMCVNPEPREFLADSQALLIEGGLEALAKKRREMIESLEEETAVAVLTEEDGLFDSVGSAIDALRLSDVAFRVFPALRRGLEPWRVARALRRDERKFDEFLTLGIRRRGGEGYLQAQQALEKLVSSERPSWFEESARLREACRAFFDGSGASETPVSDSELLFSLFAVDDERASEMLAALEQGAEPARDLARRTFECLNALRELQDKAA
jgi:hypothetical protein